METRSSQPTPVMTPAVYLNRLVKLKRAMHALNSFETIAICNNDLRVQVFRGIGELAYAAGKTLELTQRDCRDFPLELHFVYEEVSFCQLKSARAISEFGAGLSDRSS